MKRRSRYVVWFEEQGADELGRVGGKGANLARLVAAGFRVPPGFCVTADAYGEFVGAGGLQERVLAELGDSGEDPLELARRAAAVRGLLESQAIPDAVAERVLEAYGRLGGIPVAVRSSATAEDLPDASFAGQQDTYLNVTGGDRLLNDVKRCWTSLWADRAVDYRVRHGYRHDAVRIAVVVQAMLPSEVSGVLFTAHPVTGRLDEAVINASYGLGEAIVSGIVTPDTYTVFIPGDVIRDRRLGIKKVEIVTTAAGGVEERAVEESRAAKSSLDEGQVLELARLGVRVAEHYGSPQDIEWGYAGGEFHLLQCRPITTLAETPTIDTAQHWNRAMFSEILPEAPSPAFCSVLEPILTRMLAFTFERLGMRPPGDIPAIGVYYHQPYLNLCYIDASLSSLPASSRARLRDRMADPFADHAAGASDRSHSVSDAGLVWALLREARRLPREIPAVVDRYHAALAPFREADPALRSTPQLAADIRTTGIELLTPLVEYDFLLIAVLGFAQRVLEAIVGRSGVGEGVCGRGQLTSGVTGNVTMQANKALWRLSEVARRHPEVATTIGSIPARDAVARLDGVPGGAEFRIELAAFLDEHGHRESRMDIIAPTWAEDPTPVIGFVRAYLASPDAPDPAAQELAAADRRVQAQRAVHEGLDRSIIDRWLVRRLFETALATADALAAQRDTMHYHWTAAFPVIRRLMHELGGRLVTQAVIDRVEDIYMLHLAELERLAAEPRPVQDLVAKRRRSWERDRQGPWPVEIRYGEQLYVREGQRDGEADDGLHGIAGSPGVACGTVRIVRGLDDFVALRQGEILVAPLTTPVWTPLFALAAGVVTDAGGILSHGAIVAREYGIPAVMGVCDATTLLRDGETVTVDGTRGLVLRGP